MKIEGFLEEKEAKILLYRFLRSNVSYAAKLLMGVDLFPFQHMAIKGMMLSDYYLGIWARGLSKSFSTGVFASLDAMLNQGICIGIISKSFRQSKMIFNKIEEIAADPKAGLFDQCITDRRKSNDQWTLHIGKSQIIALPLGDGEKLRGFRFHRIIVDELLLMPEKILNEVVIPFLGVVQNPTQRKKIREVEDMMIKVGKLKEEDRTIFENNKLIGLSSASYKFEYLYKIYTDYERLILNQPKDDKAYRIITHLAYDMAPEDLYDKNLLSHAKNTMSHAQFEREFGAVFTDDSSGYFKIKKMAECTIPDGEGQSVEIIGSPRDEYILSVDPSWSESDSSDDFAMQLIKVNKEDGTGILVHSYAMSGTNLKKHIAYLLYVLENFDIVAIVMDYNGGVQFMSSVNESAVFQDKGIKINSFEGVEFNDPLIYIEDLKEARNQYNKKNHRICYLRKPSSTWIREANESLQAAFDHKRIMFAGMALNTDYKRQISTKLDISKLVFCDETMFGEKQENAARLIDFLEIQKENIEAAKTQCALIEVSTSPQGNQSFDLPSILKKQSGRNKARKDSYSALLLGNWMMNIYCDMMKINPDDDGGGFEPLFIK
ncbi:MAG TPA: hypothetical protein VMW42_08865 [Desulfatiglandales bacterium]|nr:hypothetical protein [Desulfatiglandales bacterium]